jgi:hypothetical protein
LPDSFVYEFESASAKSLYYEADADPDKFRHTWLYPNEAEGTDNLIEVLRPLLSKGSASHKTVDTGEEGSSTARNLNVEGPVTLTIPTVRNKLDGQLQTRLLVIELEDFENRVAEHSAKVSDTMLLSYAAKDHTSTLALWKAALEKLTEVRRVGITSRPDDFRFRSNKVAHGARLWRNFLSLMLTNAWLEQRNREVIELENGERAVVVDAEDYRVAYEVFAGACVRSGVNISENHRKILNAVYQLQQAEKTSAVRGKGYSYRQIGEKAGCSHEAVRQQKTFLVTSKGFLYEPEQGGLRLVDGAEPSWWENRDFLDGFPRPDQVEKWWGASDWVDTLDSGIDSGEKPVGKPNQVSTEGVDNPLDTSTRLSSGEVDSKNHVDKPNAGDKGGVSSVSTQSEGERINFDFEYSEDE